MIGKNKKYILFLMLIFIFTVMCGCNSKIMDTTPKISMPQNKNIPIEGKWKIENCLNDDKENNVKTSQDKLVGQYAEFTKQAVMVGDFSGKEPSYKIRKVNAEEYFTYKVRLPQKNFGIAAEDVYVVTVTFGDKYLYEFVKLSGNKLIALLKDNIYLLTKESNKVDKDFYKAAIDSSENAQNPSKNNTILRSGVLLGIKNMNSSGEYNYRTLWIASDNREIHPIMETKDIFLPRKSGFSKVSSKQFNTPKTSENIFVTNGVVGVNNGKISKFGVDAEVWNEREGEITKDIVYIGNDYICMQINGDGNIKGTSTKWHESRFILKPMDNISGNKGVKISDFYGSNGINNITTARINTIKKLGEHEIKELDKNIIGENYGLFRKAGHWTFKGRLNYEQNEQYASNDFNINLIPSSKIIFFDNLYVPWTIIKDKVPDATDAFTSPNKNIAIIITANKLYVYSVDNGKLSSSPLKKIKLQEGDTPIMAEWAVGSYVGGWEKIFMKNPTVEIK